MRHKMITRTLGRKTEHKLSMLKNLATSLIKFRKIETTQTRAKEVIKLAEKLITYAKKGDLHSKRMVFTYIADRDVVKSLFENIAPSYREGAENARNGGYIRTVKLGPRKGDGAPMVLVELI
jgi:large subunit ribosomal protein L17